MNVDVSMRKYGGDSWNVGVLNAERLQKTCSARETTSVRMQARPKSGFLQGMTTNIQSGNSKSKDDKYRGNLQEDEETTKTSRYKRT